MPSLGLRTWDSWVNRKHINHSKLRLPFKSLTCLLYTKKKDRNPLRNLQVGTKLHLLVWNLRWYDIR